MSLISTVVAAAVFTGVGFSQVVIPSFNSGRTVRLLPDDLAVLELQEPRNDLPCTVRPIKPALDFDFAFHSGYEVLVPMAELAGLGKDLTVILRIVPQNHKDDPIYMLQYVRPPSFDRSFKGTGMAQGAFALGEGRYHVDWLMRDAQSRVCATSWDLEAKLRPKDAPLRAWVQPTLVQPLESTLFGEEPPVQRESMDDPLTVGIIVNFGPQNPDSIVLNEKDLSGLVGILRRIARDPRIGGYSLVACSLQTQQILQRQENTSRIDFPAMGESLKSLHLGLVDAKHLAKSGPAQFVTNLVNEQSRKQGPDALIIVGPKPSIDDKIPRELLDSIADFDRPLFYLSYNADPELNPWRDLIGNVVKQKRGVEYTISHPKDLFNAWSDVISRIVKIKHPKTQDNISAKNTDGL